jgi:ABC-type proline/glycine betaine transport system ATPase subunit
MAFGREVSDCRQDVRSRHAARSPNSVAVWRNHRSAGVASGSASASRALAMEPSLLVADEPVSSLDVSLQGQIISLLHGLNASLGLTIVLISHDLAVVARICDRVAVMYGGQIVESGSPDKVLSAPSHPYTRALLDAVPRGLARRAHAVLPIETNETLGGCASGRVAIAPKRSALNLFRRRRWSAQGIWLLVIWWKRQRWM